MAVTTGSEHDQVPDSGRPWRIFLSYTIWSVVLLLLIQPALMLIAQDSSMADLRGEGPAGITLAALQGLLTAGATLLTLRSWGRLPSGNRTDRWGAPAVGLVRTAWPVGVLSLLPALVAVGLVLGDPDADRRVAVACSVTAVMGLLVRTPWWTSVATGAAFLLCGPTLGIPLPDLGPVVGMLIAFSGAIRSSLWLAGLVRELERARAAEAQLAVAEERLRFARDLHDVTGRDLSAIAVTAELTGQLIERQDPRALGHSREVAQIARSCLAEVRALVRTYREADLAGELQGTISLLRSAGIETDVAGDPTQVLPEHRQTTAWVLREAGTNVLRHTDATAVRIELGPCLVVVENDGVRLSDVRAGTPRHGSGLQGLAERIGPAGALAAARTDDRFRLTARLGDREPALTGQQPEGAIDDC